eukprot:TRINITY_DN33779_c0_g1_i1.p1 TRINITY_DN33779_c0_g1~~TRINITY_DN33779_c0_g1_i1.p1  ORF type:complete len:569 (-),score=119.20 TRINITY_DN33779_c0_g1_i1:118-1824(-)
MPPGEGSEPGLGGTLSSDAWQEPPGTTETPKSLPSPGKAAGVGEIDDKSDGIAVGGLDDRKAISDPAGPSRFQQGRERFREAAREFFEDGREELVDFAYYWFGALRFHNLHGEGVSEVKAKKGQSSEAAQAATLLGKKSAKEDLKAIKRDVRKAQFAKIKTPPRDVIKAGRQKGASRVRAHMDRDDTSRELEGLGWGGPPVKKKRKQAPSAKAQTELPILQQMQFELPPGLNKVTESITRQLTSEDPEAALGGALDVADEDRFYEEDGDAWEMYTQHVPIFILVQCTFVFLLYMWFYITEGKSVAGLESFWPGRTDLALQWDCEDYRAEVWRWITYQFSHGSFWHVAGNSALVILLGVPLEGFHGSRRVFLMFNCGVIGGALCYFVSDNHTRVVGMSGGVYALLGIHLGDILLNWRQKPFAKRELFFLIVLGIFDIMFAFFRKDSSTSHSAHFGGWIAGLISSIVLAENLVIEKGERLVQIGAVALGIGLTCFSLSWAMTWAPNTVFDPVRWCWARQVANETIFGDGLFHCVRCDNQACIDRWSAQGNIYDVSLRQCSNMGGFAVTDR